MTIKYQQYPSEHAADEDFTGEIELYKFLDWLTDLADYFDSYDLSDQM